MASLKHTWFCFLLALTAVTFAHPDSGLQSLHLNNIEKRQLDPRDNLGLQKRCVGDCVTCFGTGYQECASSSYICYKPGDAEHGEDTCTSGTTVPTVPTFDFCSKGDCQTCFGTGYQQCPDSSSFCYLPGDSQHGLDTCSSSSGSDSGSSTPSSDSAAPSPTTPSTPEADNTTSSNGPGTTSTDFCNNGGFDCKRCFGDTYIPCPDSSQYEHDRYCYDPNNSTSVCPDGSSPAPGSSSGTGAGTGSSSSGYITSSTTSGYTASTPSQPSSAQYSAGSTSTAGGSGSGSGSGGGSYQPSVTFSGSKTSSATAGNQTGTFYPSNSPASQTTNGQPGAGGGMLGSAIVITVCIAVSMRIML